MYVVTKNGYYDLNKRLIKPLYSWYAWDLGQIPNMAVTGPNR